jgi:hypothetical protein
MNQSTVSNDIVSNENPNKQFSEKALKFNKRKKLALHQLPFVDKEEGKIGLSFWSVPKTGGYHGGNTSGKALALLYLKYLRTDNKDSGGFLQMIALDMFDFKDFPNEDKKADAVKGQAVGFFMEIEKLLIAAVGPLGGCLDSMDERDLLKRANIGLNLTEDEAIKEIESVLNCVN